jgi:hypothetical protein
MVDGLNAAPVAPERLKTFKVVAERLETYVVKAWSPEEAAARVVHEAQPPESWAPPKVLEVQETRRR